MMKTLQNKTIRFSDIAAFLPARSRAECRQNYLAYKDTFFQDIEETEIEEETEVEEDSDLTLAAKEQQSIPKNFFPEFAQHALSDEDLQSTDKLTPRKPVKGPVPPNPSVRSPPPNPSLPATNAFDNGNLPVFAERQVAVTDFEKAQIGIATLLKGLEESHQQRIAALEEQLAVSKGELVASEGKLAASEGKLAVVQPTIDALKEKTEQQAELLKDKNDLIEQYVDANQAANEYIFGGWFDKIISR